MGAQRLKVEEKCDGSDDGMWPFWIDSQKAVTHSGYSRGR